MVINHYYSVTVSNTSVGVQMDEAQHGIIAQQLITIHNTFGPQNLKSYLQEVYLK